MAGEYCRTLCRPNLVPRLRKSTPHWNVLSQKMITRQKTCANQHVSRALPHDLHYNDDLFGFTHGRFIGNEAYEMSQRYVRFNVNELARIAAEAVRANSCVSITKYPNGMHCKAMLLTMDNGAEVVAKIPNPNAGRPHFTTASEVATMDFVRNVLETPVPRVLAWSSDANNSVGAEYVIMEKVQGIELEEVWPNMEIEDRLASVKTLSKFQRAWASVSFKKFGSLYYAQDPDEEIGTGPLYVDGDGIDVTNAKFVIGPSTGRDFFDDGRGSIEFDRGPWNTLQEYHTAIGLREMACVRQSGRLPKSPISLCGPGTYQPTRERKIEALSYYLKLIDILLPADRSISLPHIWHGDLHAANIYVDPSNPTEIVDIIDWQSTEISPLYFQARQPHLLDHDGPNVSDLKRPKFPQHEEGLDEESKKDAEDLYYEQALCVLYKKLTHKRSPLIYAALEFQHTTNYDLLLLARNLLVDGEASYIARIVELQDEWEEIVGAKGPAYPFFFATQERQLIEANAEAALTGIEAMTSIRECIGDLFPVQGMVAPDRYEEAQDALRQMKEQIIEQYAKTEEDRQIWLKVWPFQD